MSITAGIAPPDRLGKGVSFGHLHVDVLLAVCMMDSGRSGQRTTRHHRIRHSVSNHAMKIHRSSSAADIMGRYSAERLAELSPFAVQTGLRWCRGLRWRSLVVQTGLRWCRGVRWRST